MVPEVPSVFLINPSDVLPAVPMYTLGVASLWSTGSQRHRLSSSITWRAVKKTLKLELYPQG